MPGRPEFISHQRAFLWRHDQSVWGSREAQPSLLKSFWRLLGGELEVAGGPRICRSAEVAGVRIELPVKVYSSEPRSHLTAWPAVDIVQGTLVKVSDHWIRNPQVRQIIFFIPVAWFQERFCEVRSNR